MRRTRFLLPAVVLAVGGLAGPGFGEEKPTGIPGLKRFPLTKAEAVAAADHLEVHYKGKTPPESVRMLIAIAREKVSGDEGWFGAAQTRYDWAWLAARCQADPKDPKAGVPRATFPGTDPWFAALDRDKDGTIRGTDLDWSARNPYVMNAAVVTRLFRRLDAAGKGKVTKEDLAAFLEKAGKGKDHLTADDLREALADSPFSPGDAPSTETLLRSLATSELGSLKDGPALGEAAPDFELPAADGRGKTRLSGVVGKKPVVLVLGNYTCPPFRMLYKQVEDLKGKYGTGVEFLMVYVREAHPTDGWRMTANDKAGVAVAQPRTDEERRGVARQCAKTLSATMPLLVDGVDDTVGNAYSGMPGRLYVLDRRGKVAYKSGRGPFGFKAGELEQAVVLSLVEAKADAGK